MTNGIVNEIFEMLQEDMVSHGLLAQCLEGRAR